MNCRQGELTIDCASIRSIWDDTSPVNRAGMKFGNSSSYLDNISQKGHTGLLMASTKPSLKSTSFGPVGAPSSKTVFGGYDLSLPTSNTTSNGGYSLGLGASKPSNSSISHRSSVSSLWDYSSGYSSGEPSPIYSSRGSPDYSPEISPPQRMGIGSSSYMGMMDQRQSEREKLDLVNKLLSSLLRNRRQSVNEGSENLEDLLRLEQAARRASVCNGGLALDREKYLLSSHQRHFLSEQANQQMSSLLGTGSGGSTIYTNTPTAYEIALERIEREAKMRRTTAYQTDTSFTWKGTLTTRFHDSPTYATKVFVGGLPYDVTPEALTELFGRFGLLSVQFPPRGRGHAYLVFDNEQQVQALLDACENKGPGQFFFWVASRRGKDRQAQVIPWATEDSDWLASSESERNSSSSSSGSVESLEETDSLSTTITTTRSESKTTRDQSSTCKQNTVFVGALHGEITAEGLQKILSELFGPVLHVGIDTDKNRYPNGSARLTFVNRESFHRAVLAEFVQVVTPRFSKTIQLDAYIEDGVCSVCKMSTPVFCRHPNCFRYYCPSCFEEHRSKTSEYHPPVMRNRNSNYGGSNNGRNKDRSQSM